MDNPLFGPLPTSVFSAEVAAPEAAPATQDEHLARRAEVSDGVRAATNELSALAAWPAPPSEPRRTAAPEEAPAAEAPSAASVASTQPAAPAVAPVPQSSAPPAPPPPAPVYSSASAFDILPGADRGRSSRGLKLPRRGRDHESGVRRAATSPIPVPAGPVTMPSTVQVTAPATVDDLVPVVEALSDGAVPFVPATEPTPAPDTQRQRSALASEALSELSRLSTYRPDATVSTTGGGAPTLTRRTRGATAAAEVSTPQPVGPARPSRSAAEVRSMLSGFQAGVARGRKEPAHSGQEASE